MRLLLISLLMLYLLPQLFAAPTTSDIHFPPNSSITHTAISSTSSSITTKPIFTTHQSITHHPFPTGTHTINILSTHPIPTHVTLTRYRPPPPTRTRSSSDSGRGHHPRRQKPIIIFFEVLCGLFALGFLLGFLRCFCSYRRTPDHDRILNVVDRYHLQRELEELERNPLALRRTSLQEPAPPYLPPPPSYTEHVSNIPQSGGAHYAELPTGSPPGSPTTVMRSLEAVDHHTFEPNNHRPNG